MPLRAASTRTLRARASAITAEEVALMTAVTPPLWAYSRVPLGIGGLLWGAGVGGGWARGVREALPGGGAMGRAVAVESFWVSTRSSCRGARRPVGAARTRTLRARASAVRAEAVALMTAVTRPLWAYSRVPVGIGGSLWGRRGAGIR